MKKKNWIEKYIEKEKNVKIREREEGRLRRASNIIMVILLSGAILKGWETYSMINVR